MYRILITPPKGEASGDVRPVDPVDAGDVETATPSRQQTSPKVANAELQFDGELSGLTLTGFSIWDNGAEGYRVSFPTRPFMGSGGAPGRYLLLRATDPQDRTTYERLKSEILAAFHTFNHAQQSQHAEVAS